MAGLDWQARGPAGDVALRSCRVENAAPLVALRAAEELVAKLLLGAEVPVSYVCTGKHFKLALGCGPGFVGEWSFVCLAGRLWD